MHPHRGQRQRRDLAASESLVCEARQDGVRADGTSSVEVDALDDVEITAGEHAIRAHGNSAVLLAALGTCRLQSFEPLSVQGSAVVDTVACGSLEIGGN